MRILFLAFYLLSADRADYDGKNLTFSGKFQIDHPMGRLFGERAVLKNLELQSMGKKWAELTLEKGVSIEGTHGRLPFAISANGAFCELPPYTLLSLFRFQELQFNGDVRMNTLHGLTARGGFATYKAGSFVLYPAIPSAYCQLFLNEDKIDAKMIRFDSLKEELLCEEARGFIQRASLHFSSKKLLWEKGKLHFEKEVAIEQPNQFSLYADRGVLTCMNDFEPSLFQLDGNIRVISLRVQEKQSFALADSLTYFPTEKKVHIFATSPKRVLFWQEGLTLSAPEVIVRFFPKEAIEGVGDVHFSFDVDEKHAIEKLFSKYL